MKINISYDIECCYDCPHIRDSMDGVTCSHHAWPDKDYGNIIGAVRGGFPSKCPELPENKNLIDVEYKIMKYKIISVGSYDELEDLVNDSLKHGWILQGGVAINQFMYTSCGSPAMQTIYAQAMTKG